MTARDPGLQPERTALAWNRTALALAANAILIVRHGIQADDTAALLGGMVLGGLAGALTLVGGLRRRQLTGDLAWAPAPRLVLLAALAVGLAVLGGGWVMMRTV